MEEKVVEKKDDDDEVSGDANKDEGQEEQQPEVPVQRQYDELTPEKLFNALFTLADHWCPSTDPQEYKEFFYQLQHRLKYQGQQNTDAYNLL